MKPSALGRIIMVAASAALLLTGCWDRREVDDLAYPVILGVDKGPLGVDYIYTMQILIPAKVAGKEGGGGEVPGGPQATTVLTSIQSPTLPAAIQLINTYIARRISLTHTRAFVISDELARDDVVRVLSGIGTRFREVRRASFVLIAKGKAGDVVAQIKPAVQSNPTRYIEQVAVLYNSNALIPRSQLHTFLNCLHNLGCGPIVTLAKAVSPDKGKQRPMEPAPVPEEEVEQNARFPAGSVPRQGGVPVEFIGAAVFRGPKMMGELNGEEMRLLSMLRDEFRIAIMGFRTPDELRLPYTLELRRGRARQTSLRWDGDRPVIDVRIQLEADLLAAPPPYDYTIGARKQALERHTAEHLEKNSERLLRKLQGWGADAAGFGNLARKQVATWPEWQALYWPNRFPKAEIHVAFDVRIRRTGLQFQSPTAIPVGEPPGKRAGDAGEGESGS